MVSFIKMPSLCKALLLTTLFCKLDCAIFRHVDLEHLKRFKGAGLESVINKYLNPLRKLSADLPNHVIEMQIEILDPNSSTPTGSTSSPGPQRRVLRVLNRTPKKIAKPANPQGTSTQPAKLPMSIPSQGLEMQIEFVETPPASSPLPGILRNGRSGDITTTMISGALKQGQEIPEGTTKTASSSAPSPEALGASEDPKNKPVYMDDLHKAINDLEKKIEMKISPGLQQLKAASTTPCTGDGQQANTYQTQTLKLQNIDDIVQILKKAVHIEKHVPQPYDHNLNWVQLKIPKNK